MTTAQLAKAIWLELHLAQQFDSEAVREHRLGNIKKLCEGVLDKPFIVKRENDTNERSDDGNTRKES